MLNLALQGTVFYFQHQAASYNLDKPLVIGEFASESSEGESIEELYEYAYTNGYSVRTKTFALKHKLLGHSRCGTVDIAVASAIRNLRS